MKVIERTLADEHIPHAAIWMLIEMLRKMTPAGRILLAVAITAGALEADEWKSKERP